MFNLGNRVKELRKKHNMTQQELAEAISMRQESVARIEKGKHQPSYDAILKICDAFGISLPEFFSPGTEKFPPDLKQWLELGKQLTPEQRELLMKTIQKLTGYSFHD